MKKYLYVASIIVIFSLSTMSHVLAKPKLERGNPNTNYNVNPDLSVDNHNLSIENNRSNRGGRMRGQERAAYVRCLNAAKKNRQSIVSNNCSQNQTYKQETNNIQRLIPNNLPVNVTLPPKAEPE